MERLIYAATIATVIIAIFFPSLRPGRSDFLPTQRLNVSRCVELHNEIVRLGWEGMGRKFEDFHPKPWFEHYGKDAEKASKELSKELTMFLKGAHKVPDEQYFHYYVSALLYPGDDMFALIDQLCGYVEHQVNMYDGYHRRLEARKLKRYVRLYWAVNHASHPEGLIFDQHTNTAIMCMSIHDGDGLCQPDRIRWYPLEDVLEKWLDMIRIGKVKAVGPNTEFRPWKILPYSTAQLNEALQVYSDLITAIETRMPSLPPNGDNPNTIMFDKATLNSVEIKPGFAFEFFNRARRPRFRFIAPGLEVPTPETLSHQPFFGMEKSVPTNRFSENDFHPPTLLFSSSVAYNRPKSSEIYNPHDIFGWPFNASTYTSGLYFHQTWSFRNPHPDQIVLVLPYTIGETGWARKSDGSMFGEKVSEYDDPKPRGMHGELYQMGHQPYIEMHSVRLVKVLQSWLGMVERGDWKVGEEGIKNGINEWKKADTRGGWKKYLIAPDW